MGYWGGDRGFYSTGNGKAESLGPECGWDVFEESEEVLPSEPSGSGGDGGEEA